MRPRQSCCQTLFLCISTQVQAKASTSDPTGAHQGAWDNHSGIRGTHPQCSPLRPVTAATHALGYGQLLAKHDSFAQLYAELPQCTKPEGWEQLRGFVLSERPDVAQLRAEAATKAAGVVKQWFEAELGEFYTACGVVCQEVGARSPVSTPSEAARSGDDRSSSIRLARHLVAGLNSERTRQTRDLLLRYAAVQKEAVGQEPMVKLPSDIGEECVAVGKSYAMLFARGPKDRPIFEVFVGRVHGLVAAPVVSRAGAASTSKERSMRFYMSVPKSDPTALYECHPYALVSRSTEADPVLLEVKPDVHEWLPCCEDTCAAELMSGIDSDDESGWEEEEEGCDKRAAAREGMHCAATNIKCEVDVVWDAAWGGQW